MDPVILIGVLIAFSSMFGMIILEGSDVSSVFIAAPMLMVFGGTIGATLVSGVRRDAAAAVRTMTQAFRYRAPDTQETISELVEMARVARVEGLLSLEQRIDSVQDPFVREAVYAVVDSTDPQDVEGILAARIDARERAYAMSAAVFNRLGGYAPTMGIVGTVISLANVMENLSEPDELGHLIAAAFMATLWGLVSANFLWLPIAGRVERVSEMEADHMNLVLDGAVGIASGTNHRTLADSLYAAAGVEPEAEQAQPEEAAL